MCGEVAAERKANRGSASPLKSKDSRTPANIRILERKVEPS